MTKDYAKKRRLHTPRSRDHVPVASTVFLPMWAWMIAGLALGLTLAAMLYWKLNAKHQLPQVATISIEEVGQHGTTKQQVSAESQDEKSNRFDFYTVLPNMTMDIPESTPAPAATKPNTVIAEAPSTPTIDLATQTPAKDFIVQVGAFRTIGQAEELKAQLALSGVQASVQTFERSPAEIWHRVYIGPFANKQEALALQQQLQQTQALHSLVLKMRV
ncbi:MAG: SPOR domain-containing protein [Candidatus Berkiella sp.]